MSTNSLGRPDQYTPQPQSQFQQFGSGKSSNTNTYNRSSGNTFEEADGGTEFHRYEDSSRPESLPQMNFGGGGFVPPNPLSGFLANFLGAVVELSSKVSHELYTNSSVIVLGAGLAGGVHHFASPLSSLANAALDASFYGSVAVAKYVGLAFFIKTALTPIHETFTREEEKIVFGNSRERQSIAVEVGKVKEFINSHVVSYLTPMALAWIVAYSRDIPVKFAAATVYTMGTFGMMKLLGKGFDFALTKWAQRQQTERSSY